MIRQKKDVRDRFMSHVCINDATKCWEWTGHIAAKGYGYFRIDNKMVRTNRASYTIFTGHIADGLWVLHHCDNRKCVNPDHLYLGTLKENVRDTLVRNRQARGDRNSRRATFLANGGPDMTVTAPPAVINGKLNPDKVKLMRQMFAAGYRCVDLADLFGVHTATVSCAITRRTWKHVA